MTTTTAMSQRANQRVALGEKVRGSLLAPAVSFTERFYPGNGGVAEKPTGASGSPRIFLVEGYKLDRDRHQGTENDNLKMPSSKNAVDETRPLNHPAEDPESETRTRENEQKPKQSKKMNQAPKREVAKLASEEDVSDLGVCPDGDPCEDGLYPVNLDDEHDVSEPAGGATDSKNGSAAAAAMADDIDGEADTVDGFKLKPRGASDNVDAASVYSVTMVKDFRYYFSHPYFRLFLAYFVVVLNFLIYAEDPVAHSIKECAIPVIGNDFAFVGTRYPPDAWSLLKVVLWLGGTVVGMIIGKVVFHTLLFNRLFRLKVFHNDKGSWMTMFLSTILFVFIFSWLYNAFLLIGGDYTIPYRISDLMGVSNSIFMKAAATGTWCGDFFTAWMVTDMMLQEKHLYPEWAVPVRKWWQRGKARIILFWVVVVIASFIVIFIIATDYIQWDKLNHDLLTSNELSRAFLASFILIFDIAIVMQDWDFPHFISSIDIKLPGLNTAHISFKIPRPLLKEFWEFHISGKWFNYGILFIVILLDLNMWKNQILFTPFDYGQYAGPDGKIHTVKDMDSLLMFNKSLLTFDYRNSTINPSTNRTYIEDDSVMNARYYGYSLSVKAIAFIPGLAAFVVLGVLIWVYGRFKPTKTDPYAGRLKKRKKRRFSARKQWNNLRSAIRSRRETVVLKYFRRNADRNGATTNRTDSPSAGAGVENTGVETENGFHDNTVKGDMV